MSRILKSFITTSIWLLPLSVMSGPRDPQSMPPCAVIQQALTDYSNVKVGTTREDVERYFVPDGGAQFRQNSRYVYPQCHYLHIDVDFEPVGEAAVAFSRKDKVVRVSKIYVDYPAKD